MATIKYWDGSAWQYAVVGKQGPVGPTGPTGPVGQASLQRFRYVATGGQTSVSGTDANGNTLAYTPGLEEVFINGAAQVRGQDYTATNGTSITGITALIAGDVVEIYAWGVFNVANTISNTLIDAKGDILAGTGADSVGRLAVGANNTVLTADSSTATGLKWAAASSSRNYTLINTGGTALTGASTINVSGISGKDSLIIVINGASSANIAGFEMRFNSDSNLLYDYCYLQQNNGSTAVDRGFGSNNSIDWAGIAAASGTVSLVGKVEGCNSSGLKYFQFNAYSSSLGNARIASYTYSGTSTISSVNVISSSGNFDAGTIYVYGA